MKEGSTGLVDVKVNRLFPASLLYQLAFQVGQDQGHKLNLHGHGLNKGTYRMQISRALLEQESDSGALSISQTLV